MLHLYKENNLEDRLKSVITEIANNIVLVREKVQNSESQLNLLNNEIAELKLHLENSNNLISKQKNQIIELEEALKMSNVNLVSKENKNNRSTKEIDQLVNEIEFCIEKLKNYNV